MKYLRRLSFVLAVLVLSTLSTQAAVKLSVIEVPSDSVTVKFTPASGGPVFGLQAELNYKHGQTKVEMHFAGKHQPAILYGGDVTCYVLWAIEPDGVTENLGEIRVTGDNESHHFRTGSKRFALMVTAEPYGLVQRPSSLVVFTSNPPAKKKVKWKAMSFDDFARAPAHEQASITDLHYKRTEPMNLVEAQEAFGVATRNDASRYAPDLYSQAEAELQTAENLNKKGNRGNKFNNAARGSIDASAQAMHIATSARAAELLTAIIAERQARMREMEVRSEADELAIAMLLDSQADLEDQVGLLSAELQDALATVADARISAAGVVLTLPGILFKTDQALLTRDAELALAKLAGIMLVFPKVGAGIGGYTDSSGTMEHNMDLSLHRAEAVSAFLSDQGVDPGRLTAAGFGPESPIADNATPAGRTQNRRVEIVVLVRR